MLNHWEELSRIADAEKMQQEALSNSLSGDRAAKWGELWCEIKTLNIDSFFALADFLREIGAELYIRNEALVCAHHPKPTRIIYAEAAILDGLMAAIEGNRTRTGILLDKIKEIRPAMGLEFLQAREFALNKELKRCALGIEEPPSHHMRRSDFAEIVCEGSGRKVKHVRDSVKAMIDTGTLLELDTFSPDGSQGAKVGDNLSPNNRSRFLYVDPVEQRQLLEKVQRLQKK